MSKPKKGDYEVGYRRPPKSSQFKPGQTGNPRGRPRQVKSIDDVLQKRLFAKVKAQENGRPTQITLLEVIVGRLLKRAAEGDNRSIMIVLNQMRLLKGDADAKPDAASPERDRKVLEEFARLMGGSLDDLISDVEAHPDA
jgi:hypothetical protein